MRHPNYHIRNRNHNHGFSMIEVLVTLLVLSIGLLGLAAMQANSMQSTHSAYLRSQATYLAYDMLDRMRANMANLNGYGGIDTNANTYTDPGCIGTGCTPANMTTYDASVWATNLGSQLPAGRGAIVANAGGNNLFTITVTWDDPAAAAGTDTFAMTSQL